MLASSWLFWLAACGGSVDDSAVEIEDPTFDCTAGLLGVEDDFMALSGTVDAELVLGFQGFLFVRFALQRDSEGPEPMTVVMALEADGSDPFSSTQPEVGWSEQSDEWRTDELLLFLPDANTAAWTGVEGAVALKAEHPDGECLVTGRIRMVDDDPCIHTGEEPICPGDTGMPADTGLTP